MIVGLYSPAPQSGKSTVAKILRDTHGFHIVSFASPMKSMLALLLDTYGIREERLHYYATVAKEEPIPEIGKSYRDLLRTLGTEWGREQVDPDLWVRAALRRAEDTDLLVIDDVRMPNEYEAIMAVGGQVWRITRPGAVTVNPHSSDGALEGFAFDEEIDNAGSIEDLARATERALLGPV